MPCPVPGQEATMWWLFRGATGTNGRLSPFPGSRRRWLLPALLSESGFGEKACLRFLREHPCHGQMFSRGRSWKCRLPQNQGLCLSSGSSPAFPWRCFPAIDSVSPFCTCEFLSFQREFLYLFYRITPDANLILDQVLYSVVSPLP